MINQTTLRKFIKNNFEFLVALVLGLITVFYFSWEVNSWKFSFVGDEWAFYEFAKGVAGKNFLVNPLGMRGVYEQHRVLGSVWQAIFVKLFSTNPTFGWRFSNLVLIIPINIFYFAWVKRYFSPSTALTSTILLDTSFYLANFFKIGYFCPISLTLFVMSLYLAARAGNSNKGKDFVALAVVLATSFYVYIGPLFPLIVWVYLLPLLKKERKPAIRNMAILISIYLCIVLLGFLTSKFELQVVLNKTVVRREFDSNWQIVVNIFRNLILFYKNFDYIYNHYVAGPYVDLITRILVLGGTIISLVKIRKRNCALLLGTYFLTCIVIGATSPYSYAPTTRGIFFLPFGFLLGGLALDRLREIVGWRSIIVVLVMILTINIHWGQVGVFRETGYHGVSLVIKELQEAKERSSPRRVVLLISDSQKFNRQNIYYLRKKYNLEKVSFSIVETKNFSCEKIANSNILIFEKDSEACNLIKKTSCTENFGVKKLSHYYLY